MNIRILHQNLGVNSLSNRINNALSNGKYKELRILVAYVSWGGIGLIHEKLEAFYDTGNKLSLIIGIGDDGSEIDVLRYLKQRFPKANIFVFHATAEGYRFHPKLYIFNNKDQSLCFVGSNNFTNGGLFCNSECCVSLEIDHKRNKELFNSLNETWKFYAQPKHPFSKGNLHKLNDKLFSIYSKTIIRKTKACSTRFEVEIGRIFPSIEVPRPPKNDLREKLLKAKKQIRFKKNDRCRVLFLEVLKETGANGTQVQIPREVIKNYFYVSPNGHQTIEIQVEKSAIRPAVICHFLNNTHRISFPEIANLRKPFLMKFLNKGLKLYSVQFLKGREYKKKISKCKNQTRYLAKRWRIV